MRSDSHLAIVRGTVDSVPAVLEILDTTVEWLVSHGRSGQWGEAPFSQNPKRADQLREFATTGQGLWLAIKVDDTASPNEASDFQAPAAMHRNSISGVIVGALAVGEKMPYVTPVSEPELYVRLLATDRQWAGRGIGTRLLEHARLLARQAEVSLLRVDCYAGNDGKLVRYYESQGFERSESLILQETWPCQVLAQRLEA
ncbi:unnamed protein product [Penicillium olsonii]|nr:unnamed protein product [Penicillium olsonii]